MNVADRPLLEARALTKRYRTDRRRFFGKASYVHAVNGVALEVQRGETVGIVGESGCGKTTLARLLLHLLEPDAGEILLDGKPFGGTDGWTKRELGRRVQMVFQNSGSSLNPRASIREIVAFGPRVFGMPRAERRERAEDVLALVGLDPTHFAARYPSELSGGQRQRVNIARALALEPELVILDEAVSALDKSVEAQILNLLVDLRGEFGLSYVVISHDLTVIHYLCDRVMVMYLGETVESGPTAAIFSTPRHPYTKALLASALSGDPARRNAAPPLHGDPPDPVARPNGCGFNPRCPCAEEVCRRQVPALLGEAANVACHMWNPASGHSVRLA